MADGNAAGVPGETGAGGAADNVCRDGRRTAIATLDLLARLADGNAGGRQAAVAARAVGIDVEAELDRLAATRSGVA